MSDAKKQITRVAAYALIKNDPSLVLCRLSGAIPRFGGQWTLPGGGLEFGEDPVDAMVREVHEETGLTVESLGIAAINSRRLDDANNSYHGIIICDK